LTAAQAGIEQDSGGGAEAAGSLLSVRDLAIAYRRGGTMLKVVDGLSFDIRPSEIFGLVGESGSGKSTVIRSLIRLLPANAVIGGGAVSFAGRDLLQLAERDMRRMRGRDIGMVFQDPLNALNPVMTVGEQISETLTGADVAGASRRERVLTAMRLVHIPDPERLYRSYPHELSGGLRQRVAIAMALVASPKLLLADEPTTALDVTIQDQILKLLIELRGRLGMSVILVTHDLGIVAQTCQRVAVLYAGRIVESGPVERVFARPAHPYTAGLLQSIPRGPASEGRLQGIGGTPPSLDSIPAGCPFHPRCTFAIETCRSGQPPLVAHEASHLTACLRHGDFAPLTEGKPAHG
jgi:peptide/nickel transport system ATP-binding protein/oligopeptide transport system ATP-binding protein